jgi:hypothetical protein
MIPMSEARLQRVMIPVEESFAAWRKEPKYVAAYVALEDEFTAAAKIRRLEMSAGQRGARDGC